MRSPLSACACLGLCLLAGLAASGQQAASPTAVSATSASPTTPNPPEPTQSLADIARKLRSNKPMEVKMSPEDAKELFRSVDVIFAFASQDTGFPKHAVVKRN